ncbi:MAG: FIST N-terminal domain-containing protein [Cyanobacteria bacterium P01_F01_bin.86]
MIVLKVVVGHSTDLDSPDAITEVLEQCHRTLAGMTPVAGILLAAIAFDHALILRRILVAFPDLALIGGTTDGEMSSVLGYEQDSLVLILFCSDCILISAGIGTQVSTHVATATQTAVAQAKAQVTAPIQFCVTLPESLTTSAVQIVENLQQSLGPQVPIFGGLTADQWNFQQTYQFFQNQVYSDAVPVLLFSGPVLFSHGIASGWKPIGKRGHITRVIQNVVYEIDGKPALDFYRYYLGPLLPSSEYPLAVFGPDGTLVYMRAPSGTCDPESGSITFFGDLLEGAMVQITETNRDTILTASQNSLQQALQHYPGKCPSAVLLFSCASRRQILGSRTGEEYQLIAKSLKQPLPTCGFYTNGEIAPLQQKGLAHFHNETFVTLLLGDT